MLRVPPRPHLLAAALLLSAGCFGVEDPLMSPGAACIIDDETAAEDEVDRALPITVVKRGPALVGAWTSGHGVAVHGDRLYIADTDNDAVHVFDRDKLAKIETVPVGGGPEKLVVAPDGAVFVAQRYGSHLIRLKDGKLSAWEVGAGVRGVAMDPAAEVVFAVSRARERVVVFDALSGARLGELETGAAPTGVACNGEHLAVSHQTGPAKLIRWSDLSKGRTPTYALRKLAKTPTSRECLNAQDDARIPARALSIAVEPDSGFFGVAHVAVDPGRPGAGGPQNADDPDGDDSDGVEEIDPEEQRCAALGAQTVGMSVAAEIARQSVMIGYGGGAAVQGAAPCRDPVRPVDPAVTLLNFQGMVAYGPGEPIKRIKGRPLHALVDAPADIAFHPTRRLAFVAGSGTDNVLVLGRHGRGVGLLGTGPYPRALAISPDGTRLYVVEGHAFQVSEFDLTQIPTNITTPVQFKATRRTRFAEDPLPPGMRLGRRVFHNANNPRLVLANSFACATCHPDGQDDRLTWFVAEGPRQTPTLAGRLVGTGPFTWSGGAPLLSDAMRDSVSRVGGTGLTKQEMSSLVAYLEGGLRTPAQETPVDQQAVKRGEAIFHSPKAACGTCHIGGTGSDGRSHAVLGKTTGASPGIAAFNTPSLRGVALSGPWFHDGSAKGLREALLQTKSTMGSVAHLSDAQLDDLVAYLRTL